MPGRKTLQEYQNELKNISNNYEIINIEKSNKRKRNLVVVKHNCGEIFKTEFSELKRTIFKSLSGGCPKCAKLNRAKNLSQPMTLEKFRNEIFPQLPDSKNYKILTIEKELDKGNKTKIQFQHICQNCNNYIFEMSINSFQQGYRCPKCGSMYISESRVATNSKDYIKNILKLSFLTEESISGCQVKLPLKFDILFPEEKIAIEIDGEQHFIQKANRDSLDKIRERDVTKNEFCKNNNYTLLRIPYKEEKHYKSILNHFFKKEYGFLVKYNIMLISKDIIIHGDNYFEINK